MQKLSRDPYKRTISVSDVLDFRIPIKIKATYEDWQNLHDIFFDDTSSITLDLIRQFLSRPKTEYLLMLEKYSNDEPDDFSWSIYWKFINPSIVMNPLMFNKPRGGSPYGNVDIVHIKRISRWLYVFLQYWLKFSQEKWPVKFHDFINEHQIKIQNDGLDNSVRPMPLELTKACINKVFKFIGTEDEDFYKNYISRSSLETIKAALASVDFTASRYPLEDFLNTPRESPNM